jgi:hypothetical protein
VSKPLCSGWVPEEGTPPRRPIRDRRRGQLNWSHRHQGRATPDRPRALANRGLRRQWGVNPSSLLRPLRRSRCPVLRLDPPTRVRARVRKGPVTFRRSVIPPRLGSPVQVDCRRATAPTGLHRLVGHRPRELLASLRLRADRADLRVGVLTRRGIGNHPRRHRRISSSQMTWMTSSRPARKNRRRRTVPLQRRSSTTASRSHRCWILARSSGVSHFTESGSRSRNPAVSSLPAGSR